MKKQNFKTLVLLLVLIVAVVIVWRMNRNNVPVNNQANKVAQTTEETSSTEDEVILPLQVLGIINSEYLTEKDFQDYMQSVIGDLIAIKRKDIYQESIAVVAETQKAIAYLDDNKLDKAEKTLEYGLGKLEKVLTLAPEAVSVPIQAKTEIFSVVADKDSLKQTRDLAKKAMDAGDIQLTRDLLQDFRSEVQIQTLEIPLEAHGIAMRAALKLIDEKKYDEATAVLDEAMTSLLSIRQIIPIPLLNAELLVDKSKEAVESDPEKAIGMLKEAKQHIEIAELLGYGATFAPDYAKLYLDLDALEKKISGKENSDTAYSDLAKEVEDLRTKIGK